MATKIHRDIFIHVAVERHKAHADTGINVRRAEEPIAAAIRTVAR